MSDSVFWKKLADKFRKLPQKILILQAEKEYTVGQTEDAKWRLMGAIGRKAEFEALARRGASRFSNQPTDLLDVWIEKVSQNVPDGRDQNFFGTSKSGGIERNTVSRTLRNLSQRSADYCMIMEAAAVQAEFDKAIAVPIHRNKARHKRKKRRKNTRRRQLELSQAPKSPIKPRRAVASIGTHASARRMETHIESKGMSFTEFAGRAGTSDRTLRTFRKSGRIKRSVFDSIATAMGITREELLNS